MKILLFIYFFATFLSAKSYESFITKYEYGEMLYKNPRGIGCVKCHKKDGTGGYISSYKDKFGKKHILYAPRINDLSLDKFKEILMKQKYSKVRASKKLPKNRVIFMPTYFLVEDEVVSLHYYITQGAYKIEDEAIQK
jgi:hypothetical protein